MSRRWALPPSWRLVLLVLAVSVAVALVLGGAAALSAIVAP